MFRRSKKPGGTKEGRHREGFTEIGLGPGLLRLSLLNIGACGIGDTPF